MSLNDIMLNNIIFSTLLKNENQPFYFTLIIGFFILNKLLDLKIYNYIFKFLNYDNKIIFIATDKESSSRYRAMMQYIINNSNINIIRELERYKHTWAEERITYYKVKQTKKFLITDNIYGFISFKEKEVKHNANIILEEIEQLEISSTILTVQQLKNFIEKCNDDYEKHIKDQITKHQLYIDINWSTDDKDIIVKPNRWSSSCKFENKFFTDKDSVLKKLKFFLENKHIYNERGIPHTLGFLLYGEPGTGKSSFIKAVANETKYHIINIKLSKNFDFQVLHNILFNEEIKRDLIIPLNKRIIIFEDIDCMTNIVKSRFEKKSEPINSDSIINYDIGKKLLEQIEENENNNLSFLLNILDGIQESSDRIIIMTTNKPEELDKALIRSGRIDIKIHFTKATTMDIKNILHNYWQDNNFILNDEYDNKFTHADIINICKACDDLEQTLLTLKRYQIVESFEDSILK